MAKGSGERAFQANAGDPVQSKKAGELEKFARDRRLNGWRFLLSTPLGRELAWSLLADCHVFRTVMATSPFIFANAGRHDWGLQMMDEMIEADEDLYLVMQKEAMNRQRNIPEPKKSEPDGEDTDA